MYTIREFLSVYRGIAWVRGVCRSINYRAFNVKADKKDSHKERGEEGRSFF